MEAAPACRIEYGVHRPAGAKMPPCLYVKKSAHVYFFPAGGHTLIAGRFHAGSQSIGAV